MANLTLVSPEPAPSLDSLDQRRRLIATWICKSYRLCNRAEPSDADLVELSTVWDEALARIPAHQLDTAFRLAVQEVTAPWPIGHADVLTAWRTLAAALPPFGVTTPAERYTPDPATPVGQAQLAYGAALAAAHAALGTPAHAAAVKALDAAGQALDAAVRERGSEETLCTI